MASETRDREGGRKEASCGESMTADRCSDDDLFARVYAGLKALARREMSGERTGHTLQATALVSEAWLRLGDQVGEVRDNPRRFFLLPPSPCGGS